MNRICIWNRFLLLLSILATLTLYLSGCSSTATIRPSSPVGSPYGFEDEDWEIVADRKERKDQLRVVFGFQFASGHYNTEELKSNVKASFESALKEYHDQRMGSPVSMEFKSLGAGYGSHLFNEIVREIISADIAVFDVSDLNPNVMIEMGVALSWGVRVLPIKASGRPSPPSDVSGQTWVEYDNSGEKFLESDHQSKLARMVQRAIRKKARVQPTTREQKWSDIGIFSKLRQ